MVVRWFFMNLLSCAMGYATMHPSTTASLSFGWLRGRSPKARYSTQFTFMARQCEITGKSTQIGGRYSNRTRATQFNPVGKVRRKVNLHKRRIYVPELKKTIIVDTSVKGLKTIKKNGAFATLKKAGVI